MILVDSSVWIEYLGRGRGAASDRLDELIVEGETIAVAGVILQEVIQGSLDHAEARRLEEFLVSQVIVHPRDPVQTYIDAANIYFRCRRKGIVPRSSIDCLIVQLAIEHDARLLQTDRDFVAIAGVVKALRLA